MPDSTVLVRFRSPPHAAARLRRRPGLILAAIVGLYLLLAGAYSWLNPLFEAPDELWHYLYVVQLQIERGLPVQDAARPEVGPRQEGSQPPLYYLIAAALAGPIRPDDLAAYRELNYRHRMGEVFGPDQRNVVYHTEKENITGSPTARAVHLVRLLSVLLGACTLVLVYAVARQVLPADYAVPLAATAAVAFLPQFVFLTSAINNDNLAIPAATLALWLMLLARERPTARRLALLGFACGLAALAKLSAIGLLAVVAAGLVWLPGRAASRAAVARVAIVFGVASLVAGWWYARNVLLYGDPLGLNVMLAMVGRREGWPDWSVLLAEAWQIKASFWMLFGWTNVPADGWYYALADALTLAAIVGLALRWREAKTLLLAVAGADRDVRPYDMAAGIPYAVGAGMGSRLRHVAWAHLRVGPRPPGDQARIEEFREIPLLLAWIAVALAGLANWERLTVAPQGRLLFPALAPLALFFVWGLAALRIRRVRLWPVAPPLMAALTGYSLFAYLLPSYQYLPIISAAAMRQDVTETRIDFGGLRLMGFQSSRRLQPGESFEVTLYWQRASRDAPAATRFIHLERPGELIAGHDVPLPVDLPAAVWSPADLWRDRARLSIPDRVDAPVVANLATGLYHSSDQSRMPGRDARGNVVDVANLAAIRIVPPTAALPAGVEPRGDVFAGQIALDAVAVPRALRAGDLLRGTLWWRALGRLSTDYTVFIQLLSDGKVVAQYDAQPRGGRYPTSAWDIGERVADEFALALPAGLAPGRYQLIAGLYDLASGARLSAGPASYADLGVVETSRTR